MAKFSAICPLCDASFEADTDWVGQVGECPSCGKEIPIDKPTFRKVHKVVQSGDVSSKVSADDPALINKNKTTHAQKVKYKSHQPSPSKPAYKPSIPNSSDNIKQQYETEKNSMKKIYIVAGIIGAIGLIVILVLAIPHFMKQQDLTNHQKIDVQKQEQVGSEEQVKQALEKKKEDLETPIQQEYAEAAKKVKTMPSSNKEDLEQKIRVFQEFVEKNKDMQDDKWVKKAKNQIVNIGELKVLYKDSDTTKSPAASDSTINDAFYDNVIKEYQPVADKGENHVARQICYNVSRARNDYKKIYDYAPPSADYANSVKITDEERMMFNDIKKKANSGNAFYQAVIGG